MGRSHCPRNRVVPRCIRVLQTRRGRKGSRVRAAAHGAARSRHSMMDEPFVIARTAAGADVVFRPALANRHGLIAGATGTGKTVTLQVLAERLSRMGVPVFLADVKSDLTGLAAAGSASPKLRDPLATIGLREPQWAPT